MRFRSRNTLQGTLITSYNLHMLYNAQVTAEIAKMQMVQRQIYARQFEIQLRTCLVRVNTSSGQP